MNPFDDVNRPEKITTTYPPVSTSAHPTRISMNAPWQRFNNIRTERGRSWKLLVTYTLDWVATVGLTGAFFMLDNVEGFKREFDLTDTSIQHTFAVHERIPNWMLVCICAGAPLLLLPVINYGTVRSWWDFHTSYLGLILSLGLAGTITNIVKICAGRPRPDLIDRCQPREGSVNSPVFGLSNHSICTQTDAYIMRDGFRSFPSGHSSLSFSGLGFLSFYIAGKLHLFDEMGYTGKAWASAAPLLGAALVAVSRTMDYRHHWQDVTTGGLLGIVVGYFAYRQYYPPLTSVKSHRPYSPRIPSEPKIPLSIHSHHQRYESESHVPLSASARDSPAGTTRPLQPRYTSDGPRQDQRQYSTPVNLAYDDQNGGSGYQPRPSEASDPFSSEDVLDAIDYSRPQMKTAA